MATIFGDQAISKQQTIDIDHEHSTSAHDSTFRWWSSPGWGRQKKRSKEWGCRTVLAWTKVLNDELHWVIGNILVAYRSIPNWSCYSEPSCRWKSWIWRFLETGKHIDECIRQLGKCRELLARKAYDAGRRCWETKTGGFSVAGDGERWVERTSHAPPQELMHFAVIVERLCRRRSGWLAKQMFRMSESSS